jgi:hypothetical protein
MTDEQGHGVMFDTETPCHVKVWFYEKREAENAETPQASVAK